ncbi:MAG: hypothetical protein H8D46_02355 [FCB group bacterium]|nr:hypothetical protein [FCB group bacterium]
MFGTSYYLGDDRGIQHSYIDEEVQNGRTYYYDIVAYDFGMEPDNNLTQGIPPSENNAIVELDENEYVISTGPNVAVVTPGTVSAGYVSPEIEMEADGLLGTGQVEPMIFAPGSLVDGAEYTITFIPDTDGENYITSAGIRVYRTRDVPLGWCESTVDCDAHISEGECGPVEGCSWDELEEPGTWSIAAGNTYNFQFEDGDVMSGTLITQAHRLTVHISESEQDFCTRVVFNSSSHSGVVGEWTSTEVKQFTNSGCFGQGVLVDGLDYSMGVNADHTFGFTSYDCRYESECATIDNQSFCEDSPGCIWEIETLELVYDEKPPTEDTPVDDYRNDNLVYREVTDEDDDLLYDYWTLNPSPLFPIYTDSFDGIQLMITGVVDTARIQSQYWYEQQNFGQATLTTNHNSRFSKIEPWDYDIIFTSSEDAYTTIVPYAVNIYDETGEELLPQPSFFPDQSFDFYVLNATTQDTMDMIAYDQNGNGVFDPVGDKFLVGKTGPAFYNGSVVDNMWLQTNFAFRLTDNTQDEIVNYPEPGDIFSIKFARPFWATDSIRVYSFAPDTVSVSDLNDTMKDIKVVPNPYVCTNVMEEAIYNTGYNQRRKLMFTHLPAQCSIRIYTVSGVLVDKIDVDNPMDDGTIHWDLQTNEGLEIAAGMYIYHVKSKITGKEKLGKFAVVK